MKKTFVLSLMLGSALLCIGCTNSNNTSNSINRAANYDSNITENSDLDASTSDMIGRFFGNWEYGRVRSNKYNNSYSNKD